MKEDIKQVVREKYTEVVEKNSSCCGEGSCGTENSIQPEL